MHHDGRPLAACKKIGDDDSIFKTDLASGFSHPTIADLDGDGKADILVGTTDGRLFGYQTGLEIRPEWVEWAMQEGNVSHTAMWIPRKLRIGRP